MPEISKSEPKLKNEEKGILSQWADHLTTSIVNSELGQKPQEQTAKPLPEIFQKKDSELSSQEQNTKATHVTTDINNLDIWGYPTSYLIDADYLAIRGVPNKKLSVWGMPLSKLIELELVCEPGADESDITKQWLITATQVTEANPSDLLSATEQNRIRARRRLSYLLASRQYELELIYAAYVNYLEDLSAPGNPSYDSTEIARVVNIMGKIAYKQVYIHQCIFSRNPKDERIIKWKNEYNKTCSMLPEHLLQQNHVLKQEELEDPGIFTTAKISDFFRDLNWWRLFTAVRDKRLYESTYNATHLHKPDIPTPLKATLDAFSVLAYVFRFSIQFCGLWLHSVFAVGLTLQERDLRFSRQTDLQLANRWFPIFNDLTWMLVGAACIIIAIAVPPTAPIAAAVIAGLVTWYFYGFDLMMAGLKWLFAEAKHKAALLHDDENISHHILNQVEKERQLSANFFIITLGLAVFYAFSLPIRVLGITTPLIGAVSTIVVCVMQKGMNYVINNGLPTVKTSLGNVAAWTKSWFVRSKSDSDALAKPMPWSQKVKTWCKSWLTDPEYPAQELTIIEPPRGKALNQDIITQIKDKVSSTTTPGEQQPTLSPSPSVSSVDNSTSTPSSPSGMPSSTQNMLEQLNKPLESETLTSKLKQLATPEDPSLAPSASVQYSIPRPGSTSDFVEPKSEHESGNCFTRILDVITPNCCAFFPTDPHKQRDGLNIQHTPADVVPMKSNKSLLAANYP